MKKLTDNLHWVLYYVFVIWLACSKPEMIYNPVNQAIFLALNVINCCYDELKLIKTKLWENP